MKEKSICSADNPTFKSFLKLTSAHGIKKEGMAILSGPKQTKEVLRDFPEKCAGVITSTTFKQAPPEAGVGIPSFILSPDLFRRVDLFNTEKPLLLIKVPLLPDFKTNVKTNGCTLLVPFQDPANVGAVIRTAAAFDVPKVVMMKESAHPYHPKALRTAGSSLFRIPLFKGPGTGSNRKNGNTDHHAFPFRTGCGDFSFPSLFLPGSRSGRNRSARQPWQNHKHSHPHEKGCGFPQRSHGNGNRPVPMEKRDPNRTEKGPIGKENNPEKNK